MVRPALPLLAAAAALAAASVAHAQAGDRYGPARGAPALRGASPATSPPMLLASSAPPPAPALRRLSWPGKTELRTGVEPVDHAPPARPSAWRPEAMTRPVGPASVPPALSTAAPRPTPATDRRAYPGVAGRQPGPAAAGPWTPAGPAAAPPAPRAQAFASAPPPAPQLEPAPALGRYGYVGPGRDGAAVVTAEPAARAPAPAAAGGPADALGPPRPPAYARGYVMGPGAGPGEGARRYSVHREYGEEPDPVVVSPPAQFFGRTPDMSAPETEPAVARQGGVTSRSAVNAARLAASGG